MRFFGSNSPLFSLMLALILALCLASSNEIDMICNSTNDCYPKIFEPSQEFQPVRPGQSVPQGLYVRVNLSTGEKEAKLLDIREPQTENSLVFHDQESISEEKIERILEKSKKALENQGKPISSETFPKISAEKVESLTQEFQRVITLTASYESHIEALEMLEDEAHDIHVGEHIATPAILSLLFTAMEKHPESLFRQKCSIILGSALQSNPTAQKLAYENGAHNILFSLLETNGDDEAYMCRLIYALSCFIRGNDKGYEKFQELSGVKLISKILLASMNQKLLNKKVIFFIADLLEDSSSSVDSTNPRILHYFEIITLLNAVEQLTAKTLPVELIEGLIQIMYHLINTAKSSSVISSKLSTILNDIELQIESMTEIDGNLDFMKSQLTGLKALHAKHNEL